MADATDGCNVAFPCVEDDFHLACVLADVTPDSAPPFWLMRGHLALVAWNGVTPLPEPETRKERNQW